MVTALCGVVAPRPALASSIDPVAYASLRNEAGFHPDALSRYQFDKLDEATMMHIGRQFAIEYREDDRFTILVPPGRADTFLSLAPDAELVDADINPWLYNASYDYRQGYRDYGQVRSTFEKWEQEFPDIVKLQDIPYMVSNNGKKIIVAKITKDVAKDHPKRPNIVITAATHGDEHLACESLLVNIEKLLKGYASNDRFKKMIDRANIYIVPVVSPDSFLRSRNVHGKDPNRVYDYPGRTQGGQGLKHAEGMIKFYKDIVPAGVLDFHGAPPSGMIMYPWGHAREQIKDADDRKRHDTVARAMGKTTPRYKIGPIFSTIYVAPGGTVDHNYMHHDMLAIVVEIGGGQKSPPIGQIPKKAKEVEEATWIFVEALLPDGPEEPEDSKEPEDPKDPKDPEDPEDPEDSKEPEDPKESPEPEDSQKSDDSQESEGSSEPDPETEKPESKDAESKEPEGSQGPEGSQETEEPKGSEDSKAPEASNGADPESKGGNSDDEGTKKGGCQVQGSGSLGWWMLGLLGLFGRGRSKRDAVA